MVVKLVSFPSWNRLSPSLRQHRIEAVADILNQKDADFVMFSEWLFNNQADLVKACKSVRNKKVTALYELALPEKGLEGNHLFLLKNGKLIDLESHQIFRSHKEASEKNIESLITELEQRRQFDVDGKHFLVFQCGENNILKSTDKKDKRADFRLQNQDLKKRFNKLLANADVILNPVHTMWGRSVDLYCRLFKFSENRRYCFYCTQLEDNQLANALKNPTSNTAQRAMHSRRLLSPIFTDTTHQDYLLQTYEI